MGLVLTVEGVGVQRSAKLDLAEIEAIREDARGNDELQHAFAIVFTVPEPAASKRVRCADFLDAVETILREAKTGLKNAKVYYVYGTPMAGVIPKGRASGAGVKIAGLNCCIMGGVNECTLIRYRQIDGGKFEPLSVEDIRQLKVVKTDDQGDLEIRTRSKPGITISLLRALKKAFGSLPAQSELTVTIG